MKLICCAALLFVLLSSCAAADDEKCVEGHSYQKECNTCHCTSTGVYACTLIACYDGPLFPDTPPLTESTPICTPGESRMEDCNKCRCSADGHVWACTRMACPPKIPINDPGYTCTPGAVFKEECNTCTCDSSGTLARCTAMACDPNERHKRSEPEEALTDDHTEKKVCEPGTSWMEDCNRCRCSKSGSNVACTRMRCWPDDEEKHEENVKTKRETDTETKNTNRGEAGSSNRKHSDIATPPTDVTTISLGTSRSTTGATKNTHSTHHERGSRRRDGKSDSESDAGLAATISAIKSGFLSRKNKPSTTDSGFDSVFGSDSTTNPSATTHDNEKNHKGTTTANPNIDPTTSPDDKVFTEAEYRSDDFKCKPSQSFKVDCNTCWCAASGKTARYCTRIACKPKTYPPLESQ